MAAKKKTVRKAFGYRQCDDFAAYLNHMARQGWHFKEWRAGLVFEEGPPEEAHYAVEIFTKAEESDIRPLPETEEFAEYCEAAGWKFVDAWSKFLVFKRVRADAVPIMTDEERFENVAKASHAWGIYPLIYPAIHLSMDLFAFSTMFAYRIFTPWYLMFTAVWAVLFCMTLVHGIHFLLWKHQCRKRLEMGLPLFFGELSTEKIFRSVHSILLLLLGVDMVLLGYKVTAFFTFAAVAIFYLLGFILGKIRPKSNSNTALVQLLVSIGLVVALLASMPLADQEFKAQRAGEPPLTFVDMGYALEDPEIRYSHEETSVFGTVRRAQLKQDNEYVFYDIYHSDHPWVIRKLWKDEVKHKTKMERTDCTAAWGAVEAFRYGESNYLIRYEDAFWNIHFSFEEPLTQEQIDSIIAVLRGG